MRSLKEIFAGNKKKPLSVKKKFLHFQTLISANDEAHKAMSTLSEMLASGKPFSKGYARQHFESLHNHINSIIQNLSDMADGRYQSLMTKSNEINDLCLKILSPSQYCPGALSCDTFDCHICVKNKDALITNPYPYDITEVTEELALEVGSKMSRLGEIRKKLGIPVPKGFCISYLFFNEYMIQGGLRLKIDKILENVDFNDMKQITAASRAIQEILVSTEVPSKVERIILDAFDWSFAGDETVKVAVRSSAIGEDSERYSFAGLHHTELNVGRDNIVDAAWEVLMSKYSPQSLVYRYINGLRDEDMPMSVGCMEMVDAACAGVLFTMDPNGLKEGMIIHAVIGLGNLVVEGIVTPQEFIVSNDESASILEFRQGLQDIVSKSKTSNGIVKEKVNKNLLVYPVISNDDLQKLVKYAFLIEKHFGCPQDIEWVIDKNGVLKILQARPLRVKKTETEDEVNEQSPKDLDLKYSILINGGDCASRGVASGKVHIINTVKDIENFPNHGILVAKKNYPEFASLIHKVSAVITDAGSTTGHLSIIARELDIPVLTNVRVATSVLKQNMEITIDADSKKVYSGIVDELLYKKKKNADEYYFKETPLYKIWQRVGQFIFKLNLIDPNSPSFLPQYCESFHDIIRYAHEISMKVMFALYDKGIYYTENAYHLKFEVPLNIYVLDLGKGLKPDLKRKWITPEDIISEPFQSLISGMTTPGIKWTGYNRIDTLGYAQIILGNIVDSNHDRDVGSVSYALISNEYLNFFSRLGYHFSKIDVFASDEINSNYINYNFRGGAAVYSRKARRAEAVKRILEQLGFSVIRDEDNVIANIRKVPKEVILQLVADIGRLMGAVRNADVIFVSDYYVDEFIKLFLDGDPSPASKFQ